jgi:hypothetical protein
LKKLSKNSIYIILNLLYIIPGIFGAITYFNFSYNIFEFYHLPEPLVNIILIPWIMFYLMALTFTILIHPLIQIIIFYFVRKNNIISKKYIIIVFIISMAIAFVYLYLNFMVYLNPS